MARLPLLLALAALPAVLAQDPAPKTAPSAAERYPGVRHETVLRFYNLKGKLDVGKMNAALRGASMELAYGPREALSRPNNSMVAVAVPADTKRRSVERALKKGGVKLEQLEAFLFKGRVENGFPSFGIGLKKIDYMLGISGDIRWCDLLEEWTVFYCVAGELDAAEIEDRWCKLQRPLGSEPATLGEVVTDSFTWTLAAEVDARRAKKLLKAIGKLDGIAAVDLQGRTLAVTVEVAGLSVCGPVQAFVDEIPSPQRAPRLTASTNALWDLLQEEGLAPDPE